MSSISSVLLFVLIILIKPSISSRATNPSYITLQPVNIKSTQIGLFWHTNENISGVIKYGKDFNNLNKLAIDERDLENKQPGKFHSHYMMLKNLEPNTTYYYQAFYNGTNSQVDKIKTPDIIKNIASSQPIYGTIFQSNNQPSQNTIILLEIDGFLPLATFSQTSGEWLLSIEQFIAKKAEDIVLESWNKNSLCTIKIIDENGKASTVTGSFNILNNKQNNFIIGNNYNLVEKGSVKGVQTEKTFSRKNIDIIYPKENSIVPAQSPLLKGLALPFKEVYISINSQPQYNFRIQTNDMGEWKNIISPSVQAGRYVITMRTEDEKGDTVTLTRNFSIAKSGEQVLGTATPEAIPTLVDITPIIPTDVPAASISMPTQIPTTTPPVTGQMQTIHLFLVSAVALIIGAGLVLAF